VFKSLFELQSRDASRTRFWPLKYIPMHYSSGLSGLVRVHSLPVFSLPTGISAWRRTRHKRIPNLTSRSATRCSCRRGKRKAGIKVWMKRRVNPVCSRRVLSNHWPRRHRETAEKPRWTNSSNWYSKRYSMRLKIKVHGSCLNIFITLVSCFLFQRHVLIGS